MKTLIHLTAFIIGLNLIGCNGPTPKEGENGMLLDCATWINEERATLLTSNPQAKEMSQTLSDAKDSMEENVSYQLSLKSDVTAEFVSESDLNKEMEYAGHFGGFLLFTPKESGLYHVISSKKAWVDFIDKETNKTTPSTAYTEEKCKNESIFKVVEFPLEKDKQYVFYVIHSPDSSLTIAIQKKEE